MLRLIVQILYFHLPNKQNLNTSYVTVNLEHCLIHGLLIQDLNTSYVTVNHFKNYNNTVLFTDLNTSYVTVNLKAIKGIKNLVEFKYIICYG